MASTIIGDTISFVLSNVPAIMFVLAFVVAFLTRNPPHLASRLLFWLVLLAIGVTGVWAGFFHIFFPGIASASIGWAPSPFEFEIGVADAAIGVTAIVAAWRSIEFKGAVILYMVLFNLGVAAGHVREAITAHDFSANNFGVLLLVTVVQIVVFPWVYFAAGREPG